MNTKMFISHLTFIPWYIWKTVICKHTINLDRLYKCGYCNNQQYEFCKKIKNGQ